MFADPLTIATEGLISNDAIAIALYFLISQHNNINHSKNILILMLMFSDEDG